MVFVGHMLKNDGWLFTMRAEKDWSPSQICGKGNVIYLLDHSDAPNYPFLSSRPNCLEYAPDAKNPAHYVKVDQFRVNGRVTAVDPSSDRFFCNGYFSTPFASGPMIYDTKQHRKLGGVQLDDYSVALFLDGDWLDRRLKGKHVAADRGESKPAP